MREPQDSDRAVTDVARAGLFEITDEETVGPVVGVEDETEGLVNVYFASAMPGYPGWRWTVSLSTVDGLESASILETELTPGDGALLAPEWVPWADRLAEYRAAGHDTSELDADDEADDDESDDDGELDPDGENDDEGDHIHDDESDDDDDESDDEDEDDDHDEDVVDLLDPPDDIDGVDFEAASDEDGDDDHHEDDDEDSEEE